jgi:hypothetical protein
MLMVIAQLRYGLDNVKLQRTLQRQTPSPPPRNLIQTAHRPPAILAAFRRCQ